MLTRLTDGDFAVRDAEYAARARNGKAVASCDSLGALDEYCRLAAEQGKFTSAVIVDRSGEIWGRYRGVKKVPAVRKFGEGVGGSL